jgi:hypothetical protein
VQLARKNAPFKFLAVRTCPPDPTAFPWPSNASDGTRDAWARILESKRLVFGALGPNDWKQVAPAHICTGTGPTPPTLHRDWAHPARICAEIWAHPCPHLHRDWAHPLPKSAPGLGSPLPHLHRD